MVCAECDRGVRAPTKQYIGRQFRCAHDLNRSPSVWFCGRYVRTRPVRLLTLVCGKPRSVIPLFLLPEQTRPSVDSPLYTLPRSSRRRSSAICPSGSTKRDYVRLASVVLLDLLSLRDSLTYFRDDGTMLTPFADAVATLSTQSFAINDVKATFLFRCQGCFGNFFRGPTETVTFALSQSQPQFLDPSQQLANLPLAGSEKITFVLDVDGARTPDFDTFLGMAGLD